MLTNTESNRLKEFCNNNHELGKLLKKLEDHHQYTLSKISHEIRNPVTLINSFLQLHEKKHPEITAESYWIKILDNMSYLRSLLNELSSLNNSDRINKQDASPYALLSAAIDSIRPTLDNSPVALHFIKETAIPIISLDSIKLQQVFYNLLRNATEALENQEEGTITVTISCDGESVKITIEDNGCGIQKEHLDTLFEPFVTHKKDGTGLGLSISKRIVEAHQGTLRVSTAAGEGTIFTIILPIC